MSFPTYAEYKKSGVKWLGSIPSHWEVVQSRRLFRARRETAKEDDVMLTASQKYGMIPQSEFVEKEGRRVVEVIQGKENLIHVEPDDFVISMRSFQGGLEWCRYTGSTSFHYVPVTPIKNVVPSFFAHLLKSASYISALRSTTNLIRDGQEIRYSNFVQAPLPVVPKQEQLAIASFLDRETANIDALIAEQQRLIELLQEKRQAVISHAVTKGLNPNIPMKDSGVEWLGEVPEHWQVRKFAWDFASAMGQTILKEDLEEAGLPVFSATEDDRYFGHISNPRVYLNPGDIVIPARGNCIGAVKLVKEPASATQTTIYAKQISKKFYAEYIFYFLRFNREHLFPMTRTAIPQITVAEIASNRVCLPPGNEQRQIVDYVESVDRVFRGLISESRSGIDLLQERRSALISAAVTGQIDVRGLAAEVAA